MIWEGFDEIVQDKKDTVRTLSVVRGARVSREDSMNRT